VHQYCNQTQQQTQNPPWSQPLSDLSSGGFINWCIWTSSGKTRILDGENAIM